MARVYGKRWQGIEGDLGQGGQARVYTVIDLTDKDAGPYALKRILNPKRADRFRSEVEAIKALSHKNVIPLIDHSALDVEAEADDEKRYLVMPLAKAGDIGRVAAEFLSDLGRVLHVAIQIAQALNAAHEKKIIHRDVKPENILRSGDGDHVWISDFGICLIDDGRAHYTPDGEVVGPTLFMAPEQERGGHLHVTPAADIYSLGKVIYFLFSGGIRLPRENLDDEKFAKPIAGKGLEGLRLLLTQMICPLEQRLKTMDVVLARLQRLRAPDTPLALSPAGYEARNRAVAKIAEEERSRSVAREEKARSTALRNAALEMLYTFVADQAKAGAEALSVEGAVRAWVKTSTSGQRLPMGAHVFIQLASIEVFYQEVVNANARVSALQFHVVQSTRATSNAQLSVVVGITLMEPDLRPVRECSAFLRQDRLGGTRYQMTDSSPTILECELNRVAEVEADIKAFVRDALSALPDLASGGSRAFVEMRFAKPRR
ncbi:serine/threonine protein kinase [Rhizobium leguminosarum]|uniref:serine/threonine-protein kinase n=1 Tax=Rhizobium leguminosarum TaxID=384 RepID=UPI001614E3C3|nr:serine/threonine-protein kinase [Rhizobium leguminosarum]MBB4389405.1 serine/threonine protein kinase [Rhizobium leguminosarum]